MRQISRALILCVAVVALALIASPPASAANIVVNPGFETGDFTGWTASPNDTWGVSSNIPHSGRFAAFNGCVGAGCIAPDSNPAGAWLYQDLVTVPAQTYDLSFWLKVNTFGNAGVTETKVLWNGNTAKDIVQNFNAGSTSLPYIQYSVSGLSPSSVGTTRLEFISRNDPAANWLDDVCVSGNAQCAPAVPEPSAFALFGLGLAGMLGARRRIVSSRG